MPIAVLCPRCQSRYQLDPSLIGKRMRCPNTICRAVFEVREEGTAAPAAPPEKIAPPPEGPLGGMVPLLPAEPAEPPFSGEPKATAPPAPPPVRRPPRVDPKPPPPSPPAEAAQEDDDWLFGPQSTSSSTTERAGDSRPGDSNPWKKLITPLPDGALVSTEAYEEIAFGDDAPPPVRRSAAVPPVRTVGQSAQTIASPGVDLQSEASVGVTDAPPSPKRTRRLGLIILMLLLLVGGGIAGMMMLQGRQESGEEQRFEAAQALYKDQAFADASLAFQKLAKSFPESLKRKLYRFLAELSDVRSAVYGPAETPEQRAESLDRMLQFLEIYQNDPLLKDRHDDLWRSFQRLAKELSTLADEKTDAALLSRAKRSWIEAGKLKAPSEVNVAAVSRDLDKTFTSVEKKLAVRAARLELLAELRGLVEKGSAQAIQSGRSLARQGGLQEDPEVAALLLEMVKAHRAKTVYVPATAASASNLPADDELPSLYTTSLIGKASSGPQSDRPVVALARGVLYALNSSSGDVLWVRRVGIDTTELPVYVPASNVMPAFFLVLSSDTRTICAVQADNGATLWRHALDDVCVAAPLVIDRVVLVPTVSGRVEEIEVTGGRMRGHYHLGQPLMTQGTRQPGTSLVYFAADTFCLYAIDVSKRACVGILYTNHPSGSLRTPPIAWSEKPSAAAESKTSNGWLTLAEAGDKEGVELKTYALPITASDAKPVLKEMKVRGRLSSAPWHDEEKLALTTDAGRFSVFGLRQPGNRDPLLFPLGSEILGDAAVSARAQVVHVGPEDYWAWSGDKVTRLRSLFSAKDGPSLRPRWQREAGSPLHASQAATAADGAMALYLAGQDIAGPTCWMRCLNAESGVTLWQRQLGVDCQGPLAVIGERVLLADARGAYLLDARQVKPPMKGTWQPAGNFAAPLHGDEKQATLTRGEVFIHLTWTSSMSLRLKVLPGKGEVREHVVTLPALPAGTAATLKDHVLLPLANGLLAKLSLTDGAVQVGPEWRGIGVEEYRPGHVVALARNDFFLTDGGRTLQRLEWGDTKFWRKRSQATFDHRILSAPVPLGDDVLVADAGDTVTLLDGLSLQAKRRWDLGATITAGPFVRGELTCVVLGGRRLVALDPGKTEPAWAYEFPASVVGEPNLIEGRLVAANVAGQIVTLDPTTGVPVGTGYTFRANVAAAATPVAFGPGQALVPLTDGTCVLLSIATK